MSADVLLPDQLQRDHALDPSRSFIVQAPAGSGKTELLIQRYLRLLACVDEPEDVLAVTFTIKAAGEMRNRVTAAIRQAMEGTAPAEPHLRRSYDFAVRILQDERRQQWQLHRHPSRLRISTIDAVNAWLAGRAPLSAGGSVLRRVTDAPTPLYREAARATLGLLGEDIPASESVAVLLRHLDNDAGRFERLIVDMLPRREQWLRHVLGAHGDRRAMERPLRDLTENALRAVAELIDEPMARELTRLLSYAGGQLQDTGRTGASLPWAGRASFPAPLLAELPLWQGLADALLTGADQWRRTINVQQGFPPPAPQKKEMQALLESFGTQEELRRRLLELRILPGGSYTDAQWHILEVLVEVLRHAAAALRLVFAARGETDFAEVAADAMNALGDASGVSELGLALDYRLRHMLVDEFQDTSVAQFDLLRQLTAGWEPGDGRTLFLVGDPMQSIYRFREAEVGLFMEVRERGIGQLKPEPLLLRANFRSGAGIVTWTNETFAGTFPSRDDPLLGAARFASSVAARAADQPEQRGVMIHWLPAGEARAEAERVAGIIHEARANTGQERVCVLVRSRSHASRIIAVLRGAGVRFVAPELENLERASVAQDLLALTRALIHPADRLAWIGVLRAPWCGLSLADLHALVAAGREQTIPELLSAAPREAGLSPGGAAAVERLATVLDRVSAARGRRSLRDLVEGAWLDLGGPATTREDVELETAETFLRLLEAADAGGDCPDVVALGEEMSGRHGSLGSGEPGVQIMTIHKAKGLEFDTVIVPGLGKEPRGGEPGLLLWHEAPSGSGAEMPVLAPIGRTGGDKDLLHQYLLHIERRKEALEADRLLYVACTRARTRLHLIAGIEAEPDPQSGEMRVRKPKSGSLLRHLWPAVEAEARLAAATLPPRAARERGRGPWVQPLIRRLPEGWRAPGMPEPVRLPADGTAGTVATRLEYDWASSWARHAGSVVHRWLQIMASDSRDRYSVSRLRELEPEFRRMLEQLGTDPDDVSRATERVSAALAATLGDPRGRWILSPEHRDAQCELPLTLCEGDGFRELVVDRTFVAADGCRWVIDYKTSDHRGGDLEAFLDAEVGRYREQLRRYRDAMASMGSEPVRTALYFPLLTSFREVDVDAAGTGV